ncbi:MAG: TIGR00730 family Rossman fold protein [Pseudomonadota bacterium]
MSEKKLSAPRELHFTPTNGPVDKAIGDLIAQAGGIRRPRIVREMILAALKAGQEDNDDRVDLKMMNHTLKEMRFTAKVFAPYRQVRKVSVFGSARVKPDAPRYRLARELGALLAQAGFMVITGGGPGIMHAVNEGAGPDASFGINIQLPFEQHPNPIVAGNPRSVNYKYFFNRKVAFLKEADAVVLLPGGFGTLDEGMETLTLIQTGKRDPLPVVMLDLPGGSYWRRWKEFITTQLAAAGYTDAHDLAFVKFESDPKQVVAHIRAFYARYHSLRYVDDTLVVRLSSALEPRQIAALKAEFADMLLPGGDLAAGTAFHEERDTPALLDLPRLVIDFDRRQFSRLRQCIDRINAM